MKYAIIQDGVVVNVAVADGPLADNWIEAEAARIGDLWDGETFTTPAPPAPTAADVQAEADRRLEALAAVYSAQERETWATQVKEAEAIKAGATVAPMLAPLAEVRGWTLDQMADRVLDLAGQFAAGSGAILAARNVLLALDPIPANYADDTHWG